MGQGSSLPVPPPLHLVYQELLASLFPVLFPLSSTSEVSTPASDLSSHVPRNSPCRGHPLLIKAVSQYLPRSFSSESYALTLQL